MVLDRGREFRKPVVTDPLQRATAAPPASPAERPPPHGPCDHRRCACYKKPRNRKGPHMPAHYDLLIRNGTCVLPWGSEEIDVGVRDGRIVALGVARHRHRRQDLRRHRPARPARPDRPPRPSARPRRQDRRNHPHRHQRRRPRRPDRGVRHAQHQPLHRRCRTPGLEAGLRRNRRLVRHGPLHRRHKNQHPVAERPGTRPRRLRRSRSSPAAPPAT